MIVAVDVQYYHHYAHAVAVCFDAWPDSTPFRIVEKNVHDVTEYIPGEFYKRELPCLLSVLAEIELNEIELIIIDGYVQLDDAGKWGLGGYLFKALNDRIPVIGVAKSSFYNNRKYVRELRRGQSKNPLYISSVGLELDKACEQVRSMHGPYRMPTLLRLLDTRTKEGTARPPAGQQ